MGFILLRGVPCAADTPNLFHCNAKCFAELQKVIEKEGDEQAYLRDVLEGFCSSVKLRVTFEALYHNCYSMADRKRSRSLSEEPDPKIAASSLSLDSASSSEFSSSSSASGLSSNSSAGIH